MLSWWQWLVLAILAPPALVVALVLLRRVTGLRHNGIRYTFRR